MSKFLSRSAHDPLAGMALGAAAVVAVLLGVGALTGGGAAVAANPGPTTTTAGASPQGARNDVKEARADLAKLDAVVADLKAQDKKAASDLAMLQRDAKNETVDRGPTTGVVPAGADEVSAAIAHLFASHAQDYQALAAQAAAFHERFVNALNAAAGAYAQSEAAHGH